MRDTWIYIYAWRNHSDTNAELYFHNNRNSIKCPLIIFCLPFFFFRDDLVYRDWYVHTYMQYEQIIHTYWELFGLEINSIHTLRKRHVKSNTLSVEFLIMWPERYKFFCVISNMKCCPDTVIDLQFNNVYMRIAVSLNSTASMLTENQPPVIGDMSILKMCGLNIRLIYVFALGMVVDCAGALELKWHS